jgi:post-segregation antitoxin (ccd killing protein)
MDLRDGAPLAKAEQERRWLAENRAAINAYNLRVAKHGLLSDHSGLSR